jgi:3-oxoacyl-[acyl-carrier protein] reductase
MDLGLAGKSALVWGGSKGMGYACAAALAHEGVAVTLAARTEGPLASAAATIDIACGRPGAARYAVADLRSVAGRAAALAVCQAPDILINNADGPRVGDANALTRADWLAAFDAMALGPIEMIKATLDGMLARGFGRIVNITSRSVKIPQHELALSNGARSVLTGFTAGLARKTVHGNVTINNILPGIFATDAQKHHVRGLVEQTGRPFADIWAERSRGNPAGRYGEPEEVGALCAFICSRQSGFVTGQNFLIDGGSYPGTF